MIQAAGLDASDCVDGAPSWRVFARDRVRSNSVVVIHVGQQHVPQVPFAEHNDMVETFPADGADVALRIAVLPGRTMFGRSRMPRERTRRTNRLP